MRRSTMPATLLAGLLVLPAHPATADAICVGVTVQLGTDQPHVAGPACADEYPAPTVCESRVVHAEPVGFVAIVICLPNSRVSRSS